MLAAGAAVLAAALLLWPVQSLTVRPARGQGLHWAAPITAGGEFVLRWTHTVTRRPVAETYTVESDGRIRLMRMVFDQYGPNLPSAPEAGTVWQHGPEGITVTGYTERYERLSLGVGPIDHRLAVGGRELNLVTGVGPDRLIRIAVERQPRILLYILEVYQWRSSSSRS
ncbi:MAG TPA: DUF1850 domain-containing protein [Symbiobacteriaceae bacterium]|nr:DUF1850 domain-containing protein [Symbiobacteriaceae bacterium]